LLFLHTHTDTGGIFVTSNIKTVKQEHEGS